MVRCESSSLRMCVKRNKMKVSCRTESSSDLVHSRREDVRKVSKASGVMDLVSIRLDRRMAWTMSMAGENLAEVVRSMGRGLVERS